MTASHAEKEVGVLDETLEDCVGSSSPSRPTSRTGTARPCPGARAGGLTARWMSRPAGHDARASLSVTMAARLQMASPHAIVAGLHLHRREHGIGRRRAGFDVGSIRSAPTKPIYIPTPALIGQPNSYVVAHREYQVRWAILRSTFQRHQVHLTIPTTGILPTPNRPN